MRAREHDLRGIVNGIDYVAFNPATDPLIYKNYDARTFRKEKVKNKTALQADLGLNVDPKAMLIGIVSRLTDQKGFDLIAYVMDELCQDAVQFAVLGTGDEKYETCSAILHGSTAERYLRRSITMRPSPIRSTPDPMRS
jgi:starch synthase